MIRQHVSTGWPGSVTLVTWVDSVVASRVIVLPIILGVFYKYLFLVAFLTNILRKGCMSYSMMMTWLKLSEMNKIILNENSCFLFVIHNVCTTCITVQTSCKATSFGRQRISLLLRCVAIHRWNILLSLTLEKLILFLTWVQ
jgi:hypothetical protein